ncbi:deoxyuridine 5'-triphosphate nucleotidohydrolase [Anoxybacter fermentans]|uniref:Deoxyuridine 5'-triphosphate nucleotidohydrolase n=1 Tax=Anoxybacter fermentans TaxID=1323375 RepID=A0A3S9SVV1_9FIRM|nr:dUTP diphosphatase [Anoxybacter fermentans]AZR72409.1 deoxyuridine 5'-triphosphate nucleotidohydrolase [Anoxybacter fermentans]
MQVKIKKLSEKIGKEFKAPTYATKGSAGCDLVACIDKPITLKPGEIMKIPTGIAIQIPSPAYAGFIFPRSGLSSKHGINLVNCVGVIDSDYTGEIICPVQNNGSEPYIIEPGERIAQLVIMPIVQVDFVWVEELDETERGAGGFGSTGKK